MREPRWISREECLALHDMLLSQYGGGAGLRDSGLLDSALNRPRQLFAYGNPTIANLAAAYAFGVMKNHPFFDGNKRTGFVMAVGFLELNGYGFFAPEADAVLRTLALAAGETSEETYAGWLESNSRQD